MLYIFDKKSLTYKKVTNTLIFISFAVIAIIGIISSAIAVAEGHKITYITSEEKAIIIAQRDEFSEPKLIDYIKHLNLKYPYIVLAQAELESANFTSQLYRENKNFFGMKVGNMRVNAQDGSQNGYAYYDTWRDCILDYALFATTFLNDIHTEDQYYDYLRQHYAEDTDYVSKLRAKTATLKLKFN